MIYFTRQEQRIIILLGVVMLLGTGVLLVKRFQPGWIMRLSMGKPDFDVERDEKSPRLRTDAFTSTAKTKQEQQPNQTTKSDEPISADQTEQKQLSDQDHEPDMAAGTPHPNAKININTASEDDLESLPGIGPVLARRIINYRQEHGKFKDIYGLTDVSGIGSATMQKLRDRVAVGDNDEAK